MRDDRPQITAETFRNMEDMSFFTHARIFDDLLIIAQKETNCFVLRSSEGLIVLDAIWPCQQAFDAIISAVRETGWDPGAIRKLVLTHGHVDHTGCGRWLREAFHAETYLSRIVTSVPFSLFPKRLINVKRYCILSKIYFRSRIC